MAVGLASLQRAAPAKTESPAVSRPAEAAAATEAAAPEPAPESTYTPQVEPRTVEAAPQAAEAEATPEATAPPPAEAVSETASPESVGSAEDQATAAAEEQTISEAPAAAPEPEATSSASTVALPSSEIRAAPQTSSEPSSSPFLSEYATPLGGARRFGVSEPELPIDVGEEERRLHNDARRYARLLVSEIKLYNEPKVKAGRSAGDLYDRLRDDIDRSRQMYDKRVAPPVAARHDYFHQELVNMLAEGDAAKLGANYPDAS